MSKHASDDPRRAEAYAKRWTARRLNEAFATQAVKPPGPRTLRRKARLLASLKDGHRGAPLEAEVALATFTELLALGESMASLRALKPRVPMAPELTEEVLAAIRETQAVHRFDSRAWRLLGVDIDLIVDGKSRKPGRKKRAPA